jgi:hypothetical protein
LFATAFAQASIAYRSRASEAGIVMREEPVDGSTTPPNTSIEAERQQASLRAPGKLSL